MRYLLIALCFVATPAAAQPYVLAGFGNGDAAVAADPGNPNGIAWQFGVGYRSNKYFGAEVTAHRLSGADNTGFVGGQVRDTESKSWALAISAVGEIPIWNWAVVVKVGIAHVRHTLIEETFTAPPLRSVSLSESTQTDDGRIVGLGIRYKAVRLMHERIQGIEGIGMERLRYTTLQVAVPF